MNQAPKFATHGHIYCISNCVLINNVMQWVNKMNLVWDLGCRV